MNEFIFTGWMFSSTPSLNSLEHPINDIWLLKYNPKKTKLFLNLKGIDFFGKKPFRMKFIKISFLFLFLSLKFF